MDNKTPVIFAISVLALMMSASADSITLWTKPRTKDLKYIVGAYSYTIEEGSLKSVSVVVAYPPSTSDGITGYGWSSVSGHLVIPGTIGGYDSDNSYREIEIKEISPNLNSTGSVLNGLLSVVVSEGIESLRGAFSGASSLTKVELPSTLKVIGGNSFKNCTLLRTIDLPPLLENIGSSAFYGCENLHSVKMSDSLTSIGAQAFQQSGIVSLDLPECCTIIGERAFSRCGNLYRITLGGCEKIGNYAFEACTSLASISFPASLQSIGSSCFEGCTVLSNVQFSEGLTTIGSGAFRGCSLIANLQLPQGLTTIGANAFNGCSNISKMYIPNSVTSVGSSAFYNCAPTELSEGALWTMTYSSVTNFVLLEGATSIGTKFKNSASLQKVTLPSTVTKIDAEAFSGCTNLVETVIPDSVETVGSSAFNNCKRLSELPLLGGCVTNWGTSVFRYCTNVEKIVVPGSMTTIPSYMFANCSNATAAVVLDGVETISATAFLFDDALQKLSLPNTATNLSYASNSGTTYSQNLRVAIFHQLHPPKNVVNAFLRNFTGMAYYPPNFADEWAEVLEAGGIDAYGKSWAEANEEDPGEVVLNGIRITYGWLAKYGLTAANAPEDAVSGIAANGRPVWECYVAGLDPTNSSAHFRAIIDFDNAGNPMIDYSPKFVDETETSKRKYTTYGKVKLNDKDWTEVPDGDEAKYKFFKVTVEMR